MGIWWICYEGHSLVEMTSYLSVIVAGTRRCLLRYARLSQSFILDLVGILIANLYCSSYSWTLNAYELASYLLSYCVEESSEMPVDSCSFVFILEFDRDLLHFVEFLWYYSKG
jgi:hypothetical protein